MKFKKNKDEIYKLVFESVKLPDDTPRESFLDEFDNKLKAVPQEEWDKAYKDYIFYQGARGFGSNFFRIAESYVASKAKETKAPDSVVRELAVQYELNKDWQIYKRIAENRVPVLMVIANIGDNLRYIQEDMDIAGYFLGFKREIKPFGKPFIELQFEPMFEVEQSDPIRSGVYAYHWTPLYNWKNIQENGLQLRSENGLFDTPNRIYLMSYEMGKDHMMALGKALCNANKDSRNDGWYVFITLNTEEIPEECKFYGDPNMKSAYYTENPIPANAICNSIFKKLK